MEEEAPLFQEYFSLVYFLTENIFSLTQYIASVSLDLFLLVPTDSALPQSLPLSKVLFEKLGPPRHGKKAVHSKPSQKHPPFLNTYAKLPFWWQDILKKNY